MSHQQDETTTRELHLREQILNALNGRTFETDLSAADVAIFPSVDSMGSVIRQLEKLKKEAATFPSLKLLLSENLYSLSKAKGAVENGSFFASIDEIWGRALVPLDTADVNSLNRGHHVEIAYHNNPTHRDQRYEKTAEGAQSLSGSAATNSSRSTAEFMVDIFGVNSAGSESAHLMPHSPECASTWFPFVPWVSQATTEFDNDYSKKWDYMERCIHGHTLSTIDQRKANYVGIKHFRCNRIRLSGQKTYFDDNPCVFIIPILTVQQVKKWNGEGYEAIVLAGRWPIEAPVTIQASEVYQTIGAARGTILFATNNECDLACTLFQQIILCVCYSLKSTFPKELIAEKMKEFSDQSIPEQLKSLQEHNDIPVPISLNAIPSNTIANVRKVSFSRADINGSDLHPAPDPVLLCGKATCNWLKSINLPFLAGCDDDESKSDSADFIATFEEEAAIRGWTTETCTEIILHPGDTFDEELSDIE
jgi:hypothetical protein